MHSILYFNSAIHSDIHKCIASINFTACLLFQFVRLLESTWKKNRNCVQRTQINSA